MMMNVDTYFDPAIFSNCVLATSISKVSKIFACKVTAECFAVL